MFDNEKMNLEHLAEEAAEVIRIKSKCIRFGMDDYHPKNGQSNRIALAKEIGHFLKLVDILIEHGTILESDILIGKNEKAENLAKWYDGETYAKWCEVIMNFDKG
jgi:hypothetical protein